MRILIAEDDEALARFVRQGLEGEHYSVDVLPDGEQARTAATEFEYDVVILDLNLPKLDGVSVLRYLRSKKPSLPVLVLTQRTRVEDRVECLNTGADDYVPKQLSSSSLDILHIRPDLIAKLRAAAQSRKSHPGDFLSKKPPRSARSETLTAAFPSVLAIVALGTSTGGPRALQEILPLFPRDLAVPVLVVQQHATRLYRSLCTAAQHVMLRHCARGNSWRMPPAWGGLHRAGRIAHARRAPGRFSRHHLPRHASGRLSSHSLD